MKLHLSAFLLLVVITSNAQNSKFESSTKTNIGKMESAKTTEEKQSATNAFERIALAEPEQWLAQYYAAYGNLLSGMNQEAPEKKDEYYDRALTYIEKADS